MGDVPVVGHAAQFLARPVEEGLFLGREFGLGQLQQLVPIRLAREQLAFEADRARLQRRALGVRQRRQQPSVELQQRRGDQRFAQEGQQQRHRDQRHDRSGDLGRGGIGAQEPARRQQHDSDHRPTPQPQAVIRGEGAGE
jgi:hypothetical protein